MSDQPIVERTLAGKIQHVADQLTTGDLTPETARLTLFTLVAEADKAKAENDRLRSQLEDCEHRLREAEENFERIKGLHLGVGAAGDIAREALSVLRTGRTGQDLS